MHAERVQNPMGYEYYGNALSTALLLKYVPQKPFSLYIYIKKCSIVTLTRNIPQLARYIFA